MSQANIHLWQNHENQYFPSFILKHKWMLHCSSSLQAVCAIVYYHSAKLETGKARHVTLQNKWIISFTLHAAFKCASLYYTLYAAVVG